VDLRDACCVAARAEAGASAPETPTWLALLLSFDGGQVEHWTSPCSALTGHVDL